MCRVKRCTRPTATTVVPRSNGRTIQVGVCREHADLIEAGAPWTYDGEDDSIYLGEDLRVHGIKRLRDFSANATDHLVHGVPDVGPDAKVWRLELEELDGTAAGSVEFVMTAELQRNLRLMMALLQPGDQD
jgi:hypothetical protein